MINIPPLLVTSCVGVSAKYTQIRDRTRRIELTIKAIEKWNSISKEIKIVICDGSNYNFSNIIHNKFPGQEIECLFFNNKSELVARYGKGYGEGEIINYALQQSVLLKNADYFVKCTSKLWVDNFFECLQYWNGTFLCDCYFSYMKSHKFMRFKSVDTSFYIVNKDYYIDHFSSAYLNVREAQRHWLEHCFRDIIIAKELKHFMLPVAPIVRGVSGSQGLENRYSLIDKAKDTLKRFFISRNTSYLDYIAKTPDIK